MRPLEPLEAQVARVRQRHPQWELYTCVLQVIHNRGGPVWKFADEQGFYKRMAPMGKGYAQYRPSVAQRNRAAEELMAAWREHIANQQVSIPKKKHKARRHGFFRQWRANDGYLPLRYDENGYFVGTRPDPVGTGTYTVYASYNPANDPRPGPKDAAWSKRSSPVRTQKDARSIIDTILNAIIRYEAGRPARLERLSGSPP